MPRRGVILSTSAVEGTRKRSEWLRRSSGLLILLAVGAVFSLLSENFRTLSNLTNVALQTSLVAIVTIGMTFTLLTAGIDLSVGSVAAFAGALGAGLMARYGWPISLALLAGLGAGALLGLVNGALTVYGRLPPFVSTLAMLGMARGFTLVFTQGKPIAGLERAFTFLGTGDLGPFPMPVVVWIIVLILAYSALRYTRFGLYIYAIGGNEETARLAGIRIHAIKIAVYVLSGVLAAITGLLLTARLFSAQPQVAVGLELDAIGAAVLGGVSLFGGVGSVVGASIGALIIGVLGNGLNLMGVPSFIQQVIKGIVLVLAVVVDLYSKRRSS